MMPYIQGEPDSVPEEYLHGYENILEKLFLEYGKIGYLTIDESKTIPGLPHRGQRAKHGRALHTEAGIHHDVYCWGGIPFWGGEHNVSLEKDTRILVGSNTANTTAIWDDEVDITLISDDGDIGYLADEYPYDTASILDKNEIKEIGIFTPHESLPVQEEIDRIFIRIVGEGVSGREPYFTENPLIGD
jgi:hypothetical protein